MDMKPIIGNAWCYGDNINTDLIYPGNFLTITEPTEMAKHALAGLDENFGKKVKLGDLIVAGDNFGAGSSREQAAMALKFAGVSAIIAKSFARIFYRNAINQGIYTLISPEAIEIINPGEVIELDLSSCMITNKTKNKSCTFEPLPEFLLEIIDNGGIIPHLRKKLKN